MFQVFILEINKSQNSTYEIYNYIFIMIKDLSTNELF